MEDGDTYLFSALPATSYQLDDDDQNVQRFTIEKAKYKPMQNQNRAKLEKQVQFSLIDLGNDDTFIKEGKMQPFAWIEDKRQLKEGKPKTLSKVLETVKASFENRLPTGKSPKVFEQANKAVYKLHENYQNRSDVKSPAVSSKSSPYARQTTTLELGRLRSVKRQPTEEASQQKSDSDISH